MCVALGPEGQRERKASAMALAGWPQPHPRAEMHAAFPSVCGSDFSSSLGSPVLRSQSLAPVHWSASLSSKPNAVLRGKVQVWIDEGKGLGWVCHPAHEGGGVASMRSGLGSYQLELVGMPSMLGPSIVGTE